MSAGTTPIEYAPWCARSLVREAGLSPGSARGAVFYPPIGAAARVLEPVDSFIGHATRLGAAFVAIGARKPAGRS